MIESPADFLSLDGEDGYLIFFFDDSPVGYFQEPEFPTVDGRYSYMSFRGPGHYEMVQTCLGQGFAVCCYIRNKKKTFFTVERTELPGRILSLSNFRKEDA
jgi:hypothetical protein